MRVPKHIKELLFQTKPVSKEDIERAALQIRENSGKLMSAEEFTRFMRIRFLPSGEQFTVPPEDIC